MGRRDLGVCRRVCIWMGQTETAFLPASLDGSDRICEFAGERKEIWMGRAAAGCLPASLDLATEVRILCAESGFDVCKSGGGGGELGDRDHVDLAAVDEYF
jgi:hypothetical protein